MTDLILPVEGMTCASCVRRVEKALQKVDGVQEASVNLATEKARVVFDPEMASVDQLRAAVDRAGYRLGTPPPPAQAEPTPATADDPDQSAELDDLRRKWQVSLGAGGALMALMYLPLGIPIDVLAPILLIVAAVVQFWAGAPIYRAAWASARHGGRT